MSEFKELELTRSLMNRWKMAFNDIVTLVSKPKNFKESAFDCAAIRKDKDGDRLYETWREYSSIQKDWNKMRTILELPPFEEY